MTEQDKETISRLERENRILKKKLKRSEHNRVIVEEAHERSNIGQQNLIAELEEKSAALASSEKKMESKIVELNQSRSAMINMLEDLDEEKLKAEAAKIEMEKNKNLLTLLMDSLPVLIAYIDKDLRYRLANAHFKVIHGIDPENMIGSHIREVIGEEGYAIEKPKYERALAGETVIIEDHFLTPLGVDHWYKLSLIPHFNNGVVIGIFGLVIDLTEQKKLETDIRNAKEVAEEATKAKSDFLANMSHEIRTPMNAIIGMSHLALQTKLSRKQKDYIDKIHSAGNSLLGIINDILDFSKIEA